MAVVSCAGCERFVHDTELECPFCGEARTPRAVSVRRPHIARAAIVALALTGCGGAPAPVYGGPPMEDEFPQEGSSPGDVGDEDPDEELNETGADTSEAETPNDEFEGVPPVPIYGAPAPE